jgi:hypothetical protein
VTRKVGGGGLAQLPSINGQRKTTTNRSDQWRPAKAQNPCQRHALVASEQQAPRKDGPAIEWPSGKAQWWLNGQPHRSDGPAIDYPDGRAWWLNGQRHREDGSAVERADGKREWWLHGELHRDGGPTIEREDGTREWSLGRATAPRRRPGGPASRRYRRVVAGRQSPTRSRTRSGHGSKPIATSGPRARISGIAAH